MTNPVFTIGHSTHEIETFVNLLKNHKIDVIADVRSTPYSKFNPQYNASELKQYLALENIKYVPLGKEFGARSEDKNCYKNGKVQYDLLAQSNSFRLGLERIKKGAKNHNIALMCSEKDPIECHRSILVSRYIEEKLNIPINHILTDGTLESHQKLVERLLEIYQKNSDNYDLFLSDTEKTNNAYKKQERIIAYEYEQDYQTDTLKALQG